MKNINEELTRMLYLTQHKRGVVISEQYLAEIKSGSSTSDWKGKTEGVLNFSNFPNIFLAKNIFYVKTDMNPSGLYTANIKSYLGKELPITKSKKIEKPLPTPGTPGGNIKFEFKGSTFPYPDNIVTPMFDMPKYKRAKDFFNFAIEQVVLRVKQYGPDVIKKITIKGSADSAKPTNSPDLDYVTYTKNNTLDHNYGGSKDPTQMNQYLADERANRMKDELIKEVKSNANVDITNKITVIKGDNWYDPNFEGRKDAVADPKTKRYGVRSVTIDIIGSEESVPGTEGNQTSNVEYETYTEMPVKNSGFLNLTNQGGPSSIPYYEEFTSNQTVLICIKDTPENAKLLGTIIPNITENGKLNGKTQVNCSVSNDGEVTIDGKVWGILSKKDWEAGNESATGFETEPIVAAYNRFDDNIVLRNVSFELNNTLS